MRVRKTQNPSYKQIKNMVANLREFRANANIQTFTNKDTSFWISNGHNSYGWFDTWQDLQQEYRKIMKHWQGV